MNRFFLRDATRDLHARLDARISVLDLGDPADYAAFLRVHAGALLPLEAALEAGSIGAVFAAWPQHRRSAVLRADLSGSGLAEPEPPNFDAICDPAAQMGVLYVLEGSRLGGRLMERQAIGQAYKAFLHHGLGQPLWQDYLACLEALPDTNVVRDGLAAGARLAFDIYRNSAVEIIDRLQHSGRGSVGSSTN